MHQWMVRNAAAEPQRYVGKKGRNLATRVLGHHTHKQGCCGRVVGVLKGQNVTGQGG